MNNKLFEDIRLAIGERSYSQVAESTGISKPTLSRIVNQTYKRAISPTLLWKIAESAHNNVTFELLMHDACFTDGEIASFRRKFEGVGISAENNASSFIMNVVYVLLTLYAESCNAFTHVFEIRGESTGVLIISTNDQPGSYIYIIDGLEAEKNRTNAERFDCELLGRCVLLRAKEKGEIRIVTPDYDRFTVLSSVASAVANQVILVDRSGEKILERISLL